MSDRDFLTPGNNSRTIVLYGFLFALLALSVGTAFLLFEIESGVFPQLIGDQRLGTQCAAIFEMSKVILTLAGWFVVGSRSFRAPTAAKIVGMILLPFALWSISGLVVFSSISLTTSSRPGLEATRQADMADALSQFSARTNVFVADANARLGDLDKRLKASTAQTDAALADARIQFNAQAGVVRDQISKEVQAAGTEQDFDQIQKLAQEHDDQIERERARLRQDFERKKEEARHELDAGLIGLNRQRDLLIFHRDTSVQKGEVVGRYDRRVAGLTRDYETRDNALRAGLRLGSALATSSHTAAAKLLQDQLGTSSKRYQNEQSDLFGKQRALEAGIAGERRAVYDELEKSLASSESALGSRLEQIKVHDYTNDRRIQNPLVTEALATIREGLGIESLTRPRFVGMCALLISGCLELVAWVSTVWASVVLTTIFIGVPIDFEMELKKKLFANDLDLTASSALFPASANK